MFTIAVDKQEFNELLTNGVNEYQKNRDGTMKFKCKKFSGKKFDENHSSFIIAWMLVLF